MTDWVAITGGAGGIGLATARCVAEWSPVLLLDRADDGLRQAAEGLRDCAKPIRTAVADVTDEQQLAAAYGSLPDGDGLRGLVNSAGIFDHHPAAEMPREAWQRVIDVNLTGTFLASQQAYPRLRPGSAIVNISSIAGHRALKGRSNYAVSKAGVVALTNCLAIEWASRGIRVVCVSPGLIMTAMAERAIAQGLQDPAIGAARTPAGRYATPAEVGHVVSFLLSDKASYLTGIDVPVDGGWLASGAM